MDRALLERLLEQNLSLAEIGRRLGRHEATVAYWLQKHQLSTVNHGRHQPRGAPSRPELGRLVEVGASIAQVAKVVGRSKATARYWLHRYGLRTKTGVGARARDGAVEAREAGLPEAVLRCPRHGSTGRALERRGYYRCRRCRQEAVVRRRRKVKETLVFEAGGRCRLCGYDRCLAG
jgi:transposase